MNRIVKKLNVNEIRPMDDLREINYKLNLSVIRYFPVFEELNKITKTNVIKN